MANRNGIQMIFKRKNQAQKDDAYQARQYRKQKTAEHLRWLNSPLFMRLQDYFSTPLRRIQLAYFVLGLILYVLMRAFSLEGRFALTSILFAGILRLWTACLFGFIAIRLARILFRQYRPIYQQRKTIGRFRLHPIDLVKGVILAICTILLVTQCIQGISAIHRQALDRKTPIEIFEGIGQTVQVKPSQYQILNKRANYLLLKSTQDNQLAEFEISGWTAGKLRRQYRQNLFGRITYLKPVTITIKYHPNTMSIAQIEIH